ncbi:hypothetical protein E4U37_000150, partial [Claviceps purpurea]
LITRRSGTTRRTPLAHGARRDAKGALRKLPGWKYPELRDIAELFDRRNKCDFKVKDGRLLVQVSFYVDEEQTVATPRSGRRDRRKRRPTVGFEDEGEGAEQMTPSHLSRKRSAADPDCLPSRELSQDSLESLHVIMGFSKSKTGLAATASGPPGSASSGDTTATSLSLPQDSRGSSVPRRSGRKRTRRTKS